MKPELKKLLLLNLPYLLFVYLFAKCGQAYRLAAGADASAKLLHLTSGISAAFANPLPSLHPFDLCVGVAGAVAVRLIVYSKGKNAKKYRKGEEYGSARWGTAKDIAPYIDPKFENNILLTQTERLTMTGRPKDPKTARNKNVLVIGGSGSGKTRFYVKPNLMQCFPTSDYPTSFVVTDPKGTLVLETGQMFQRAGYRVKILNTINFSKSMKYNPFVYIHSEKDVLKLVNTLIANTKGEGEKSAEDFWVKSERLFYTALIGYIWYEAPAEEMNFTTLLEMINASEAREDDPDFQSPVDLMFERLEQKDPDHFAVRQYKKFLLSAGKTRSSILISCGARLAPFDIREIRELLSEYDFPGDDIPVIQGSALKALEDPAGPWGDKIMELMNAVDEYIPDPQRDTDKPFVMPVEDVFSITGRGTVATGRVEAGVLHVSDEVEIVGIKEETRKVVVTGIEMFRKLLDEAQAGDNIGALLRGVQRNEIERGQVLAKPGTITCHTKFTAQVYVLTKDEGGRHTPFFNNYRPQFYFRTTDVTGVCNLPEGTEMCMPGDNIEMTIELIHPIAMSQGLTFAIREGGRTVGSGRVATIIE